MSFRKGDQVRMTSGWIGVDLDGTLAVYPPEDGGGIGSIGEIHVRHEAAEAQRQGMTSCHALELVLDYQPPAAPDAVCNL